MKLFGRKKARETAGHFTEVMLIRSAADEKEFKETYGIESLKVEY